MAYEVAPFNIKVTIVQPNFEINLLTNRIASAPLLPQYSSSVHPAPLARAIVGRILDRIHASEAPTTESSAPPADGHPIKAEADAELEAKSHIALSSTEKVSIVRPHLPAEMLSTLVAETVHALAAIGGHENPPARHIVGSEAVASVKEKLKTNSEELEDFVEASISVDVDAEEDKEAQ